MQKGFSSLILLGVILILIIGVGSSSFLFLNKKDSQKNEAITPVSNTQISPIPSSSSLIRRISTADEFSKINWQIFRDDESIFKFEYPQGSKIQESESIISFVLIGPKQQEGTEFYDGLVLNLEKKVIKEGETFDDLVKQNHSEMKEHVTQIEDLKTVEINGLKGYSYISEGLGKSKSVFLQLTDRNYLIVTTILESDSSNIGFNQSTERIINSIKKI